MSGAEAITALQSIDACIGIAKTIIEIARAVRDARGLPPRLRNLLEQFPAIEGLLKSAHDTIERRSVDEDASKSLKPILGQCERALCDLKNILEKACPADGENRSRRIWRGTKTVFFGRDSQVQKLLVVIQDNLGLLEQNNIYNIGNKLDDLRDLTEALSNDDAGKYMHSGSGHIVANEGGTPTNYFGGSGSSRQIYSPGAYHEGPSTNRASHVGLDTIKLTTAGPVHTHNHLPPERKETPPPPTSNVPFRRDTGYIERAALTNQIHAKLSLAGRVALVGLGGVGKSQLAIQYSYQYRGLYPKRWALWIHAGSIDRLQKSVGDIAELMKIPRRHHPQADVFQLLRFWLLDQRNGHWLAIVDNADDASFLIDGTGNGTLCNCLPVCDHGAIIVTSRDKNAARQLVGAEEIVDVPTMDEKHAIALLTQRLGEDKNPAGYRELVFALDFMPLAITQAAAYLKKRGSRSSLEKYLEELRELDYSKQSLLDYDHGDLRRDPSAKNSILLTWQISFEFIRVERKSAADLLSLMSLCDRQAIPEPLINRQDRADSARDQGFQSDLDTLIDFSFITVSTAGPTYGMHRLVQVATRKWLVSQGAIGPYGERLIHRIDDVFAWTDHTNLDICGTLYPHTRFVLELEPSTSTKFSERWLKVMRKAACFAVYKGSRILYIQAIELQERILKIQTQWLGKEHPDTFTSMSNLASYYNRLGEFKKAAKIEEHCWEASKLLLGEEHPHTLTLMSNLASYYNRLGETKKAAKMEEHCWEIRKQQLGEEHLDTLASISNLASYYGQLGDSKKAAKMEKRCWEARKQQLGEEHPNTLTSMNNLASYYDRLGDSKKAIEVGEKCWEASKQQLGEEHPDTLTSMSNLVLYYFQLGDSNKAAEIGERYWEASKQQLGEEHPHTLNSAGNLAVVLSKQGRQGEGEQIQSQVVRGFKKLYGLQHPDTQKAVSNLAWIQRNQGQKRSGTSRRRKFQGARCNVQRDNATSKASNIGRTGAGFEDS